MNTLLSILIGITIIAGSSYSMLKNAEEVETVVLDYDDNKYCKIRVITDEPILDKQWGDDKTDSIKSGYVYSSKGRYGEVPHLNDSQLKSLVPNNKINQPASAGRK